MEDGSLIINILVMSKEQLNKLLADCHSGAAGVAWKAWFDQHQPLANIQSLRISLDMEKVNELKRFYSASKVNLKLFKHNQGLILLIAFN